MSTKLVDVCSISRHKLTKSRPKYTNSTHVGTGQSAEAA